MTHSDINFTPRFNSIKYWALEILKAENKWIFGGELARRIRGTKIGNKPPKESVIERRLRELENAKLIEANYDKDFNNSVKYRITPNQAVSFSPSVYKSETIFKKLLAQKQPSLI